MTFLIYTNLRNQKTTLIFNDQCVSQHCLDTELLRTMEKVFIKNMNFIYPCVDVTTVLNECKMFFLFIE